MNEDRKLLGGDVTGRIRWHFKFAWTPGGEAYLPEGNSVSTPWWSPALSQGYAPMLGSDPQSSMERLKYYYCSVLPLRLFLPFEADSDFGFPSGWFCGKCGKLNRQVFLRHRRCSHCEVCVRVLLIAIRVILIS